jgi:hypothetical protein
MTTIIAFEQLPREIAELFETAQSRRVVVTRNGAPFALIVGVNNKDDEDLQLEFDPAFWRMIQERRKETECVSLEEFKASLGAEENGSGSGSDGVKTDSVPQKP